MKTSTIRVKRLRKIECYRAIKELEERGFECIKPITSYSVIKKDYKYKNDARYDGKYFFDGYNEIKGFYAIMRKID
ncbi:hypothetical protein FZC79_10290 [Rossellomorea vietnamensis]|uniref:Uncharacterized protein n=1 Tax=Rossellomorea vietnamensis TaxID=218284 RepID=A0A5D4KDX3_9BACI|nr:hypothetical protein [Rossellomorea vietnamensis]TYR75551.1 hypothetical protein FZC79_10290 [Rossellomorea vietnamensis]